MKIIKIKEKDQDDQEMSIDSGTPDLENFTLLGKSSICNLIFIILKYKKFLFVQNNAISLYN